MNILSKIIVLLITLFTTPFGFCRNQIPNLQKKENTTQLIVKGKPFLIFGGELENFSAASMENRQPIWPKNCQTNEQKYPRDNKVEFLTKSPKNKLVRELNQTALKLSNHLLSSPKYMKYETSFLNSIHYAEVCAAYGVSKFAQQTNNTSLMLKLLERYKPLQKDSIAWRTNHVDGNVYGVLPLQFYQYTKDKNYLEHGLFMANSQWKDTLPDGMTNQTRYWIDDVFMVSSLQINAYQATKNQRYLDNAALFTAKYIDSLQQKNGLFYHGSKAPIYWGRW